MDQLSGTCLWWGRNSGSGCSTDRSQNHNTVLGSGDCLLPSLPVPSTYQKNRRWPTIPPLHWYSLPSAVSPGDHCSTSSISLLSWQRADQWTSQNPAPIHRSLSPGQRSYTFIPAPHLNIYKVSPFTINFQFWPRGHQWICLQQCRIGFLWDAGTLKSQKIL